MTMTGVAPTPTRRDRHARGAGAVAFAPHGAPAGSGAARIPWGKEARQLSSAGLLDPRDAAGPAAGRHPVEAEGHGDRDAGVSVTSGGRGRDAVTARLRTVA